MPFLSPEDLVRLYESPGPAGDPPPLHDLCQMEWSSATHAHGAATDVPGLLRALISDDALHREFAAQLLFETIWHQGDIYEATPLAVPFLYNLLEADGPHDKEVIAFLLCCIAEGQPPYGAKFEGDSPEAKMWRSLLSRKGMDPDAVLANERRFMNELRRQLDARSHLLIPYRSKFASANRVEG